MRRLSLARRLALVCLLGAARAPARGAEFQVAADSFTVLNQVNVASATYYQGTTAPASPDAATQLDTPGGLYFDKAEKLYKVWDRGGSAWVQVTTGAPGGVPAGAVAFFELAACPAGWSEVTDARGRYLVGLPASGTLGATVGTALSNSENRAVGQHNHGITDPGHVHSVGGTQAVGSGASHTVWTSGSSVNSGSQTTGLTVDNAGSVAGTNAPYKQLLVCKCTGSGTCQSGGSAAQSDVAQNLGGGSAGAVPYQSAANVTTFVGIGAAGTVLTSNGSAPAWASPASDSAKVSKAGDTMTGSLTIASNANLQLGTTFYVGNGRVGVGTASPGVTLDVAGPVRSQNVRLETSPADVTGVADTETTVASLTGTFNGLAVFIYADLSLGNSTDYWCGVFLRVRLDNATTGTIVRQKYCNCGYVNTVGNMGCSMMVDHTPAAGSHTYYLTGYAASVCSINFRYMRFGAWELPMP